MTYRVSLVAILILTTTLLSASAPSAAEKQRCKTCGMTITGSYFETGSHFYHPDCFTCAHCDHPIQGSYTVYRSKNYHDECFEGNVALRCMVCDEIIQGEYLLDYWGNAYHKSHKGDVLQCDFCQRFIVGALITGMVRLPDGRRLCGKCAPTSITSVRKTRDIAKWVAGILENFGISIDPRSVVFRLVGIEELRRIASDSSHDTKGFTDYRVTKNLFGQVKNETIRVYLLNGMPLAHMKSTLAHELTHVWQFQQGRLEQDEALSEGSCNFASYLVLRKTCGEDAEYIIHGMLNDNDPIYGEGFRRVKAYAEKEGLSAWLNLLKKNADLSRL